MTHTIKIQLFADDTVIYVADDSDNNIIVTILQEESVTLADYLSKNRVSINISKSKVMFFSTKVNYVNNSININ